MSATGPPDPAATLVGRERELAALRAALDAALAGRGSLVLIGGEAGIGKTALAEALLAEATDRGALVLVGRCYDLSETPPYGPWAEALARTPHDTVSPPPDLAGGGQASQEALFTALRDYLAGLTATRPLILLLDDLHWADPASLDLLRILARSLADLPLLVLATYRADEIADDHPLAVLLPLLVREAHAARLDLRPLDEGAIAALVAARYALAQPEADRLVGYLAGRTEGNALFLGELLRTLEGEGLLRQEGSAWVIGDLAAAPVPALLRQVIARRVARLDRETQRLLAIAAVIGQEVPLPVWAAVAEVAEDALLDHAERALAAQLLTETADGAGVRFAHALIREALYAGLPALRRRGVHRRAGETLARAPRPDPDAVAYHFAQAGDPQAAAWLIRAGERAQRAFAYLTAGERFAAALARLEQEGVDAGTRGWLRYRLAVVYHRADPPRSLAYAEEAARLADVAGDRALAAAALAQRGLGHFLLGCGLATLEAGVAAIDALPPDARGRMNRVEDPGAATTDHNRYWGALVRSRAWVGPYPAAQAAGARFLAQFPAPAGADTRPAGDAQLGLGIAHAMLGRVADARRAIAAARAIAAQRGEPAMAGVTAEMELKLVALPYQPEQLAARRQLAAEVTAELGRASSIGVRAPRLFIVPLLVLEGAWAEARALALAGADHDSARRGAQGWLGLLARAQGEPALARTQLREALPDGPATAPEVLGTVDGPRTLREGGALALDAGDLPLARRWLACHDRWLAWSGAVLGRAEGQLSWAAYHRAAGDPVAARTHAEQARAHATDPRQPLALLAAARLLGELDTAAGRHPDAQGHLDQALLLAEACAAPYERGLTLLALAELRATTGARAQAGATLAEARALLIPLEAAPALARADALLARLSAPPPASSAPAPFELTAREAEVLRLVAQGLSDAEVAARLFVSVHTVKTHLRAVYGKLGVPSRTAAARLATAHGLA